MIVELLLCRGSAEEELSVMRSGVIDNSLRLCRNDIALKVVKLGQIINICEGAR